MALVRERTAAEPYRSALGAVWGVAGAEGFYSAYLAAPDLALRLRAQAGHDLSTDDRPRIEFGFIRNLGRAGLLQIDEVRRAARGVAAYTGGDSGPRVGSSRIAAITGFPSIAVPAALAGELPIGVAFVGRPDDEARLFAIAAAFERARGPFPEPKFLPTIAD